MKTWRPSRPRKEELVMLRLVLEFQKILAVYKCYLGDSLSIVMGVVYGQRIGGRKPSILLRL
jgi:hypothetical protein